VSNINQRKMSYLEAAQKNHTSSSPFTQLEAKIAKIESFMETMQFVIQHIIDKGIAQERKEEIIAAVEKEKAEKKKKTTPPQTPQTRTQTTPTPEQQQGKQNSHSSQSHDSDPNSQKLDEAINSFNKRMMLIESYMEKVSRYIDNNPHTQTQPLANSEQTQSMSTN